MQRQGDQFRLCLESSVIFVEFLHAGRIEFWNYQSSFLLDHQGVEKGMETYLVETVFAEDLRILKRCSGRVYGHDLCSRGGSARSA